VDATFELCFEHDYESRSVDPSVPLLVFFNCEGRDNSMAFGYQHAFSWLARRADVSRVFAVVVNDGERGDIRRRVSDLVGPGHVLREVSDLPRWFYNTSKEEASSVCMWPLALVGSALHLSTLAMLIASCSLVSGKKNSRGTCYPAHFLHDLLPQISTPPPTPPHPHTHTHTHTLP
jgi:hypothetical protein